MWSDSEYSEDEANFDQSDISEHVQEDYVQGFLGKQKV